MVWRRCFPAVLCVGLLVSGCGDDSPTAVVPTAGTVTLDISHQVGGVDLVFNSMTYTNAAGDPYNVVRLNYLISNVELLSTNGTHILVPGPFFIDAADATTLKPVLAAIPPGTYEQVRFTFGLDETVNNTGEFLAEPWHSKMQWPDPLGGGYHYMILDGFVLPGQPGERTYNTHLGRTQTDPHYFRVTLDVTPFSIDGNNVDVALQVDINQWYEAPNVYSFPDPAFIMDRPDAQETLRQNGETVFTVSP